MIKNAIKIIFKIILIITLCIFLITLSSSHKQNLGYALHLTLNNSGDKLYASFPKLGKISELDSVTLEEIRCFDIIAPDFVVLSPDNHYLYTASVLETNWPISYFIRIDLITGERREIALSGQSQGFTIDNDGEWIWIVHRTFPIPGEFYDPALIWHEAWQNHKDSGHLTRINASSFTIDNTVETSIFPMSVWYSEYSDQVFVLYEQEVSPDPEDPPGPAGVNAGIVIDAYSSNLLQSFKWAIGGKHEQIFDFPTFGCNWSDDGRYFIVPSSAPQRSKFSLRVFDTYNHNNSIAFDIIIPTPNDGTPMPVAFVDKVKDKNILWAVSQWGNPLNDLNRPRTAIKINTETRGYELFELAEATSPVGYFDASNDGRILYISLPKEGAMVVCCPDNLPPDCFLFLPMPIPPGPVPAPFAVTFDATRTRDPNDDTLTFEWDFDGDGVFSEPVDDAYTGEPNNPTHLYYADFDGNVTMRVRDPYDGECTSSVHIHIDIV